MDFQTVPLICLKTRYTFKAYQTFLSGLLFFLLATFLFTILKHWSCCHITYTFSTQEHKTWQKAIQVQDLDILLIQF